MLLTYILFYTLIGLLTTFVYLIHKSLNYWKSRGIPHDEPHPIHGHMEGLRKTRNVHEIHTSYYNKYRNCGAPFCGFYFLQSPRVFVLDTQLAKNILIKDFSNFSDKGLFHNERDDPLSAHLFNLDGIKWKQLRHKLSSTFTSGKMKFMYPTVAKVADELIAVMSDKSTKNEIIEIKEMMSRFTVDVIGVCAFGIECNSLRNPQAEFLEMGQKVFTHHRHGNLLLGFLQTFPALARKLRMRRIHEDVHRFYMQIVKETVQLREEKNIKRNDFMDLLIELKNKKSITLENGEVLKGLTMDELTAQAFVFFAAGFETSSSTMGFALYELSKNQDVQDKLRTEIIDVLAEHKEEFTYECMKDLQYLDQVIAETLRLYTIVPVLDRKALKDYVVPGNPKYVIEKGMSVIIPACAMHRDPRYYPEPEKFEPERFSPEMVAKRESTEWLPFGDGPRNCIGMRFGQMQARVGLALLIKNFKFSLCEQTKIPLNVDVRSFTLGVIDGIHLRVEKL